MSRVVRAVAFDLDGTLIASLDDILDAANFALAAHELSAPSRAELASYVGDGARALIERAVRRVAADHVLEPVLASFLEYYLAHPTVHTQPMPGAVALLERFQARDLALCTNKPRALTLKVLENLDLQRFFAVIVAGDDLPRRKPAPDPLLEIARRFGVESSALALVGDSPHDVLCAQAAGALAVGVKGGIAAEAALLSAQPDHVLATLSELPEVLARYAFTPELGGRRATPPSL